MAGELQLDVNEQTHRLSLSEDTPLLQVLRDDLRLNGPKFGCGLAQCGACAVLVNGRVMRSCVVPATSVEGMTITTLEGLGTRDKPHPIQTAFVELQAMQCGYCANGMMIAAANLLESNSSPSRAEIVKALDAHLCRCGSHTRIIAAVQRAAEILAGDEHGT